MGSQGTLSGYAEGLGKVTIDLEFISHIKIPQEIFIPIFPNYYTLPYQFPCYPHAKSPPEVTLTSGTVIVFQPDNDGVCFTINKGTPTNAISKGR